MASLITVNNSAVSALLNHLQRQVDNASPVLMAIGEDMVERTKQRFATATGPDGVRWRPNTQVTIIRYLQQRGGFGKKGKLGAKGQKLAIGKRPLQGLSGSLANQIYSAVTGNGGDLVIGSTMRYAAMQQFGGTRSQFPNLWGNIPARPFFPIMADGTLSPSEEELILERLRQYLSD